MLTKDDLSKIQLLITDGLGPITEEMGGMKREIDGVKMEIGGVKREIDGVKDEIKDVRESIRLIPNKEEFFDSMDKLMGEVKKSREEQEVIGNTLSQHNDRLEKLEEKVGISATI